MMEIEREAKFEVPDGFVIPTGAVGEPEIQVRPADEKVLEATYYDTSHLDLARWGVTLRFRRTRDGTGQAQGAKWTLKLPDPVKGDSQVLSRTEVDFEGGPDEPPAGAKHLVRALRRGRRLRPVCDLTTTRTSHLVLSSGSAPEEGSDPLAEIDDDAVEFRTWTGRTGRFHEIEVELKSDSGGPLIPKFAQAFVAAGASQENGLPKVLRALEWSPPPLPPQSVSSASTAESLVSYAIADSMRRLLSNEPMVHLEEEPEPVHQARVATRRLRSDLATLGRLLKPKALMELRGDLRATGRRLGDLRDADVMLERLRKSVSKLPADDQANAQAYLELLSAEQRKARARALRYLSSKRYASTVDELIDAIDHPPVRKPDQLAVDVLPSLIARRWKALNKRVLGLGDDPPNEELHRVRIDAKRCRYAAELAAPVMGDDA
ncbi:MAG TPA: CYTH and CHAD domain-containing protein, partial [Acidimicrobiales bacterium]|nr:CYTH and CHAD domain-containing protein [Acidimicrobiales bacterium]